MSRVPRLFVPPERIAAGRAKLTPEDVRYLSRVLRLAPGADLELFDGAGGIRPARLEAVGDALELAVGPREERPALEARVDLAFALARGERCDLVVQKATELGVTRLAPFAAHRSVVRLEGERAVERTRRWRRIAAEAARQCGRADVPAVEPPTGLAPLLAAIPAGFRAVLLSERGGAQLSQLVDAAAPGHLVIVGPEGGFEPAELEEAACQGALLGTLGPRILRFETACVVAVALVRYLLGALG